MENQKAEKRTFEIEHWPNYFGKHAMARMAKGYLKGWLVFGTAAVLFYALFHFTHIFLFVYVFRIALFGLIVSPFLPIISYFQRDKKNPAYGINADGFLLNERGWNSAFFAWDEIQSMKEFDHPIFGKELHFEFESFTKAMNKPNQKFEQALRREYEIEKQPKKISGQLVKGDVGPFIEKFKTHFNAYKAAQPMKKEKAFKIATDYVENYSYPITIDLVNAERKENLLDFEGPVWLFSMPDLGQSVVVSEKSEKVLCMLSRSNQKAFPHDYENPLSKEEAFAIGKKYLAERHPEAKAIFAKTLFYQGGMNNIKDPVWHVGATLPPSRFDGQNEISLWISVRSKQVEDTEIS